MKSSRLYSVAWRGHPARLALAVGGGAAVLVALLLFLGGGAPAVQAGWAPRAVAAVITDTVVISHTSATTHEMSVYADGRVSDRFITDDGNGGCDQIDVAGNDPYATTLAVLFDQHASTPNAVDVGAQGEFTPTGPITLQTASTIPGYSEDSYVVYASGVLSYQVAQRTLATTTNNCVVMELVVRNTGVVTPLTGGKLLYMVDVDAGHNEAGDAGFYDASRRMVYLTDYSGGATIPGFAVGFALLEGNLRGYTVNGDADNYPYIDPPPNNAKYPTLDPDFQDTMIDPVNLITDGANDVAWLVADLPDLDPGEEEAVAFALCAMNDDTESAAADRMLESFDEVVGLSVSKTATPTSGSYVSAGERITCHVSIRNTGDRYVDNLVVTDSVPASTDLITYSVTHGSITAGGGVVTATIGRLYPASGTVTVTLVSTPSPGAVCGRVIANRAYVTGEPVVAQTNVITHRLVGTSCLGISKGVSAGPLVLAGQELTYTIVVSNGGPTAMSGVLVTDTIPAGAAFVTATLPHTGPVGGVITWPLGVLDSGVIRSVDLVVRVDSAAISGTEVANTAWVTGCQAAAVTDAVTSRVAVAADLVVAQLNEPDPALAGATLTYTLVYTNAGPSDAVDVMITDTLPLSVTFGGWVEEAPPIAGPTVQGRRLTWYTPTLAAGASGTIVFTTAMDAGASGVLSNDVVITSSTPDPVAGNNSAIGATQVATACLTIAKTAADLNGVPLYVSDEIFYRVDVTGACSQADVTVVDFLPGGMALVAGSVACTPGATCGVLGLGGAPGSPLRAPGDFGGMAYAILGSFDPGDALTLTFRSRVNPRASSIGGNVAVVGSSVQGEMATGAVYPPGGGAVEPGLIISKVATDVNGAPLWEGDVLAYAVVVTNTSATYSQANVAISDTLVASTTLVPGSVSCTPGAACVGSGGLVTATLPALAPGGVLTLAFQVTVDEGTLFVDRNVASVESDNQNEQRGAEPFPFVGSGVLSLHKYLPLAMRGW